jgi:2-phospho-L-lactate guanylyltransferase
VAIVPVKRLTDAKSRLALPAVARQRLALAFARDVVAAALASAILDEVVVVSNEPMMHELARRLPLHAIPEPAPESLGGAVESAREWALRRWPRATTLVIPADLPRLAPGDITEVVEQASGREAAFVPDTDGRGTTLLLQRAGATAVAQYGPDSAARHAAAGMYALDDAPMAARQDVDSLQSLRLLSGLSVGPETQRALEGLSRTSRHGERPVHLARRAPRPMERT